MRLKGVVAGVFVFFFAAVPAAAQTHRGTLAASTTRHVTQEYAFEVAAGQHVEVKLTSDDFDTILQILTAAGDTLENDDDGEGTNSRLMTIAVIGGRWIAIVSAYDKIGGDFELEVSLGERGELRTLAEAALSGDGSAVSGKGQAYRTHTLQVDREASLILIMTAPAFSPALIVVDPDGQRLHTEASSAPAQALLDVPRATPGTWTIIATHRDAHAQTGNYTLKLVEMPTTGQLRIIRDSLTAALPVEISGEHYRTHTVTLGAERHVHIDLTSPDFDTFLAVRSPSGRWFRNDDGENTDSHLELDGELGEWQIVVTSFAPGKTGRYTLKVRQ